MSTLGSLMVGYPQFFDNGGNPLTGGKVNAYAAGTLTPQNTYSDAGLSSPNANPVVLDSAGRAAIFLDALAYKFVVTDSGGVTLTTIDNIYPSGYVATQAVAPVTQTSTLTGTQNDFALTTGCTLLRLNNATDLTITGFSNGVAGQRLDIVSIGAGNVYLANQNVGSVATNRIVNIVTSGNTPLAAGVGTARLVNDGTVQRWRLAEHEQGAWIVPLVTTYSGGGGQTFALGSVLVNRYRLTGRTLEWQLGLSAMVVGGTPNPALFATLPGGMTAQGRQTPQATRVSDNGGTSAFGTAWIGSATTQMGFYKDATEAANWTGSAGSTIIEANMQIEVQ